MGFLRHLNSHPALVRGWTLAFLIVLSLPAASLAGTPGAAHIEIFKDTVPDGPQDFHFSVTGGPTSVPDFDLDDDSDTELSDHNFVEVVAGTYVVTEDPVAGFILTEIDCSDPTENSSVDVSAGTATMVVDGTETVSCTFTNTEAGKLIIDKVTEPAGDPTAFDFELIDDGSETVVDSFSLGDEDTPYMRFVLPGTYEVSETVPAGWELLSDECDNEDTAQGVSLSAGDTVTCTFVNRTTVTSNLGFIKEFSPDVIGPGSSTTLTFTITNPDGIPAGLLTFSDDLPAAITVAGAPNVDSTCGGTVVAAPGGSSIGFSGGSVPGFGACTVSVDVTASTPGVHSNTSNPLTSTDGVAGGTGDETLAMDDLEVDTGLPGFSKSFAPSTVSLGGRSTLTFLIDNSGGSAVLNLDFTDNLPLGLEVASPANASTTCGTPEVPPSLIAEAGSSLIILDADGTFAFPALAASSTCTVTVDVVATASGKLENVSDDLLDESDPVGRANATLTVVTEPLHLTKEFTDDPVPPGTPVTLEFTITNFNRDEGDSDDAATSVAFSDDLTTLVPPLAGLTFASVLFNDCGGTVTGVGGTTIGLSGATVPPEGSCTLRVSLSVPPAATPGVYTNTSGAVTGMVEGMLVTGNTASDDLFVSPVPILTKEFRDATTEAADPVVNGGDDVIIRFTVFNTSTTSGATDVEFLDELTDGSSDSPPDNTSGFLPFPVTVTLPPDPDPPCGGGSSLALVSRGTDRQALELTGGSLDPSDGTPGGTDTCTFDVTVTIPEGFAPGIYTNHTEEPTATVDGATRTGLPSSDTLTVVAAPQLSKEFLDDPVAPDSTVTLQFTLTYAPDQIGDATAITFTDDLAAMGLAGLVATGLPLMEACDPDGPGGDPGTGTLSGSAGDTLLTFAGGVLSPGESCSFNVDLTVPASAAAGSYTNETSGVGAMVGGVAATSQPAEDDLDIAAIEFSKEFDPDVAVPGETVTLRFTIENVHPTDDATITHFTDDLAAVLPGTPDLTTGTPASEDTCGGTPSVTGGTFITYTGGSVLSGESCTIAFDVVVPAGAPDGTFTNTSSFLSTSLGTIDPAIDQITVNSTLLELTKEFTDDPVAPGDPVTLEFTLTNLDPDEAASGIDFTDDLGAALTDLTFDSVLFNDCGATVSGTGTDMITVTGASLAAGGSCTIRVSLTVPVAAAANIYVNETSGVTGTIGGFAVSGDAASDELIVFDLLAFSKSFDGPAKEGETAVLTFTITNPGQQTVVGLAFSDDLDDVLSGLVATGLPMSDVCGAGSMISGTSFLTFTGGELPGSGGMCSFDVDVVVPLGATVGTYPNTTSALSSNGLEVAPPATADLVVEGPIDFTKAFAPDPIGPGSTTTLTFTIANVESGELAEDVAFTDVLPAGVVIATPSSAFTDCTDGVLSAPDGGTTISLSGARVGDGATCTVTVNVTAAAAGSYDNVSGVLSSSIGGGLPAKDTLTVDDGRPGFSKSFSPGVIPPGGVSTLTFLVDNSANGSDLTGLFFTDSLPAGLVIATPSNKATSCNSDAASATLTAPAGGSTISLSALGTVTFPVLDAGETCTVTVDVTAASAGLYENVSLPLDSDPGDLLSGFATAVLDVRKGFLIKSFTDDPVVPGGTVTLEFEINNPSRDFPATAIAFTDTIDPMGGLTPVMVLDALPRPECGGTLDAAGGVISFTGGSLPAEGSCTFSVVLQLPAATDGSFVNTTSTISATIDGMAEIGDPASDILKIVAAPVLTKEFLDATTLLPDPVVGAGDDIVIRFSITNTSSLSGATAVTFSDELTALLPFPVDVTLPPVPDPPCGLGSSLTLAGCGTDCQELVLADGSLDAAPGAGATCSFDVTLTLPAGLPQGTYLNTTSEVSAMVDGEMVAGAPASDTFDVVAPPRLTKEFLDDPVLPGGTVTLEFTLEHDATAPGDAVDVGFTDDLAATLTDLAAAAGELPAMDLCGPGNGMLVGTAGDTLLTFSGATLAPGEICTFSVTLDIPVDADAGSHLNKTSNVVATVLGIDTTGNPAEDDLMIGGVVLTKAFLDDPVIAGGMVTLEFVITNQTPDPVTDITFTDVLDPDVLVGLAPVPPLPTDPCGPGSTLTGTSTLTLSGGSLDPTGPMEGDGVCSFSVTLEVPAATPSDTYVNRTSALSATVGGMPETFPGAEDDLVVATEQLLLTKEFIDDPVVPGGTVTLEFSISTLGEDDEAADLAFSDDLGAALAGLEGVPPYDTGTCGGTLTGTSLLDFSGGSLTAGECSFSVTVQVPMAVPFGTTITNTTSALTGTIGGLGATGEPASDDLVIDFFTFEKFFDGLTKPSGTVTLTFMITNLSTMDTVSDLGFIDDLDAVIPGLEATSLPAEPCGVGSSISGTSVLTLTGGTLLPGGSCSFDVELLVPADSGGGSFLNTTSDLEQLGVPVSSPATAFLDVEPPPFFGKAFLPDFIAPGFNSTLSFLIDNSDSLFDVTDLAFTDVLPAGVSVSLEDSIFNDCGGMVTAIDGGSSISLSGGSVAAGDFCMVQVGVTATTPGIYVNTSGPLTSSSGESAAAIDTLTVVDMGGECLAPDGEDIVVIGDTYVSETEIVVCKTAMFEAIGVLGPDGHLIVKAGVSVAFGEDTVIGADGELTVIIDPILNNMP